MSDYILTNYHTHTARCHHARGTDAEYVEKAIELGYKVLGFCDHTPFMHPLGYSEWPMRMRPELLEEYIESIRNLKKIYSSDIKIYIGLEAEYFPNQEDYLKQIVRDYSLDYLLFGNHYNFIENNNFYFGNCTTADKLLSYTNSVILGLQSGIFKILGHPDVHFSSYPVFDEHCKNSAHKICKKAVDCSVVLEYNLLGADRRRRKKTSGIGYTTDEFWKIASEYPVRAIISSDAHAPNELDRIQEIENARIFLQTLGVTVLDTIPNIG